MSESYKTHSDGLYFVSFSVVGWIDVFTRREYQDILVDSIAFCQKNKEMKIFFYCIMPSHVHFITYSVNGSLSDLLRDFKSFTAKKIMEAIEDNPLESRKEWLMNQFAYYGSISPQKQEKQFWKHDNHPFYLYSNKMIQQKIDYIHFNPVEAGFVNQPQDWRLSSASDESPVKTDETEYQYYLR